QARNTLSGARPWAGIRPAAVPQAPQSGDGRAHGLRRGRHLLGQRRSLAAAAAAGRQLADDRAHHAEAVAEGLQMTLAVDAIGLIARNLGDPEPGLGRPYVDQRLDLEAGSIDADAGEALGPEGVVAVA